MEIKHIHNNTKGSFDLFDDEKKIGEMTYSVAGTDKIIIDHTFIDPDYNGKGLGKELLEKAVDWVRKEQIKIVPLCPFANRVLRYNEQYKDVLAL